MADLTTTVPEFRTLQPFKSEFPYPKDPEDSAWYAVSYGEPLASVDAADVTGTDNALTVETKTVTQDAAGVALFLTGGTDGMIYSIRIAATTQGGDSIHRTVRLTVATR